MTLGKKYTPNPSLAIRIEIHCLRVHVSFLLLARVPGGQTQSVFHSSLMQYTHNIFYVSAELMEVTYCILDSNVNEKGGEEITGNVKGWMAQNTRTLTSLPDGSPHSYRWLLELGLDDTILARCVDHVHLCQDIASSVPHDAHSLWLAWLQRQFHLCKTVCSKGTLFPEDYLHVITTSATCPSCP